MCGGKNTGALLGALAGIALAPVTAGASLGLTAGATTALAGAAGAMAGDTLVDKPQELAQQGIDAQKAATDQATAAAKATADQAEKATAQADMAYNKANPKAADILGLMDSNQTMAKGGQSGTMLTGAQGVDPATLLLGKKTLLGA